MGLETATYIASLDPANPAFNDPKSQGDDHLRLIKQAILNTFPNLGGRIGRVQQKTGSYGTVAADNLTVLRFSGAGPYTLSAEAAATLGNGWSVLVINDTTADLTFDPNAAEIANGAATVIIPTNHSAWIINTAVAAAEFVVVITRKSPAGVVGAVITGNITLTSADVGSVRVISATAAITLPASATMAIGDKIGFKSITTGNVVISRQGADTIDGLTSYRLPAYCNCEITKYAAGLFVLSQKPADDVGDWKWTGYDTANQGWVKSGSGNRNRTTDAGLFAVYGTFWGAGDGSTTFGIPSSVGRELVQAGIGSANETFTAITAAANAVATIASADTWHTGMAVVVSGSSGFGGTGLANGTHYVVKVGSTLSFASSLANAQNGTVETLTGTGTATITHTFATKTLGQYGGREEMAMTLSTLLAHTHGPGASTYIAGINGGGLDGGYTGGGGGPYSTLQAGSTTTGSRGGNATMNIRNPYIVGELFIKL